MKLAPMKSGHRSDSLCQLDYLGLLIPRRLTINRRSGHRDDCVAYVLFCPLDQAELMTGAIVLGHVNHRIFCD